MKDDQSPRPKLTVLRTGEQEDRVDDTDQVGAKVREIRKSKGLSLAQLSETSGVPTSTLSKFETGTLSLPLDRIFGISDALGIAVTQLFDHTGFGASGGAAGRRSISRATEGRRQATDNYDCRWLFPDLIQKRMFPVVQEVLAKDVAEFGPLLRHDGEEFVLVLEGKVEVVTDIYEPIILEPFEGIYIDSRMAHAYLKASSTKAVILNVSTSAVDLVSNMTASPEQI